MSKTNYKYSMADLKIRQELPLSRKETRSLDTIEAFYNHFNGNVYVSNSGGTDSVVLMDLVRRFDKDIVGVYCSTGLDYPSVREMATLYDNIIVLRPKKSHFQILTEFGYPCISKEVSRIIYGARHGKNEETRQHYLNRLDGLDDDGNYSEFRQGFKKWKFLLDAPFEISNMCCYYLKEKACRDFERETGLHPITGLMADESQQRLDGWRKSGCNAFDGDVPMSKPLSTWTKRDIHEYLYKNEERLLKEREQDAIRKGMTKEEFYQKFPHPWANAYGDIVPVVSKNQLDGQIDMFHTVGIKTDGCNFKTTGCDRTGCLYCMYGSHCQGDERYLRLKESEPTIYDFVMRGGEFNQKGMWVPNKNGLGFRFVIEWINKHGDLNIQI